MSNYIRVLPFFKIVAIEEGRRATTTVVFTTFAACVLFFAVRSPKQVNKSKLFLIKNYVLSKNSYADVFYVLI